MFLHGNFAVLVLAVLRLPQPLKSVPKTDKFSTCSYYFDESKFDDFDTAKTVYIGAGKSGLSYRFYDKDKEVCSKHNKTLDEVGSWKRTEMQLRDDKALAFAMTFKDNPDLPAPI